LFNPLIKNTPKANAATEKAISAHPSPPKKKTPATNAIADKNKSKYMSNASLNLKILI